MGPHDLPLDRRRFLTAAAMAAGAVALPGLCAGRAAAAVPPQVTLPDRGIHDTATASAWTDGFVTGNGEYGAVYYGAPTLEKMIFNHHRFVLPNGTRTMSPPVIADRLASVRDKALAGDYSGAQTTFASGWSLRWTQTYHPGYELRLDTPGMTTVNDFARVTDFRTGEVTHTWTDQYGTWKRHAFVSRADQVIVHELLPATGRTVDTTLSVNTALDGVPSSVSFSTTATVSNGDGYLNLRGTYPAGGAYGYEGVTRVVVSGTGSSVTAGGSTLVVARATKVLLLTKLGRYETSTGWNSQPLQTALAGLTADYATLLAGHAPLHQAMYDRSSIDLNVSPTDRQLSTSELIARQNGNTSTIDLALLERNGSTADGAPAIIWTWNTGTNQQWRFLPNHDGSFRLACAKSGKLLESPDGSTTQGQTLDQSTDTAGAHQWWKLVPATSGYHRLVNVKSGMCADAQNGYTADGTPLIQWPPNTGSNQEWQIVAG